MKRVRVLLVEDEEAILEPMQRCLESVGFSVTTSPDGVHAMAALEGLSFDALVTDVRIPGPNGLALLDWVQEHRSHMRVVVISALGSTAVRELSLKKGAALYLEKPADPLLLIEVLNSHANRNSFSGSVGEIELFEYVQLMLLTKRRMVLELRASSGAVGTLFLDNGNVMHATCGNTEGEEAFFRCLAFEGGSFTTLPWRAPPGTSVPSRGDFLLMEAARRKDEAQHEGRLASAEEGSADTGWRFDSVIPAAFGGCGEGDR
jgi:CheY-like chemotaxis protein